ncbi:SpoIIE family protein phosphatase [Streptomyces sp. H27-C3]|uniref:SpoIIE family protein phosphatase n=1 Tax=Streptomyces sp. H27-C3 TaxID=3046305 RepID=UPI0024BA40FA|nr:SpoIIE family protein phosphatase [Streptomyces sp. H27-C3]MDJ0464140.1 SpoIIE family protein phosphatase [Streptomyces sp. H27-C3]
MNAWDAAESADFRGPLDVTRAATAVLDAQDTVVGWSPAAEALLGYRPGEIVGRPLDTFLPLRPVSALPPSEEAVPAPDPPFESSEIRVARHRAGHELLVATAVCLLPGAEGAGTPVGTPQRILVAAELEGLRLWESRLSMLHGLATQSPVGLGIYDTDLRLTWCNAAYEREIGRPFAAFRGMRADELYPGGTFVTQGYPKTLDAVMRQVIETGEPVLDLHFRAEQPSDPGPDHLWSCSYYRLQNADGHVLGVCEDAFDITDRYQAQNRLALLVEAGRGVGTTLDAIVTAEEIAGVAVPAFADLVTVDFGKAVLEGEVPVTGGSASMGLVRVAWRSGGAQDTKPSNPGTGTDVCAEGAEEAEESAARSGPEAPGERGEPSRPGASAEPLEPAPREPLPVDYPPGSPQDRSLASGGLVLDENTLVVPLRGGGSTLGLVTFVRGPHAAAFDSGEVALAHELVARTSVSVDNARRFTRERTAALALQRQLLPQHVPQQSAVDLAYRYLPADDQTGVGGDWFDVIPLSGTRVGLVVGDVVGHGLQAAATMGRLRTTVRAFAQMDMSPDELLTRLDDLVGQAAEEQSDVSGKAAGSYADVTTGATCLYAVYDPVSRRCVMARAGHLPPAIVYPDGRLTFPDLPAGPPLGLGGLPFESMEIELPVGSLVALFTDGLVEARDRDIDVGLDTLGRVLSDRQKSLEELCDRAVAELLPDGTTADDTALLLVRTRELDARQVVDWELPAERVAVSHARELATGQLRDWGLEDLTFATQLVVSELVTNAIRYAEGPLHLRLIRDRTLLCEVADTGHTSPHLRHSAEDDEGGRGLFIVAQLVQRWGTRYTRSGKTIWTEQSFPSAD